MEKGRMWEELAAGRSRLSSLSEMLREMMNKQWHISLKHTEWSKQDTNLGPYKWYSKL